MSDVGQVYQIAGDVAAGTDADYWLVYDGSEWIIYNPGMQEQSYEDPFE